MNYAEKRAVGRKNKAVMRRMYLVHPDGLKQRARDKNSDNYTKEYLSVASFVEI